MPSVLIIADDHNLRVALRQELEKLEYLVFSVGNGMEGLSTLAQMTNPNVVVLDYDMRLMTGDAFLQAKNRDPDLAKVPVILLSAASERPHSAQHECLPKPFAMAELLAAVKKHG